MVPMQDRLVVRECANRAVNEGGVIASCTLILPSVGIARRIRRCGFLMLAIAATVSCGKQLDPSESLRKGTAVLASGDSPSARIELKNAVQGAPDNAQSRMI